MRSLMLTAAAAFLLGGTGCYVHSHGTYRDTTYREVHYGYYGAHPVPAGHGHGWCLIESSHNHAYAPDYTYYTYHDGYYAYSGPTVVYYYDYHPDPHGGMCHLRGRHSHNYHPGYHHASAYEWDRTRNVYVYRNPPAPPRHNAGAVNAPPPPGRGTYQTPPGHGSGAVNPPPPPGRNQPPPGYGSRPPPHGGQPPGGSYNPPPGHGGTPPGHGGTPPGHNDHVKPPGHINNPGHGNPNGHPNPPGHGNRPPFGHGTSSSPGANNPPPGHGGTPPGHGGRPPGHNTNGIPPGHMNNPGHGGSRPGQGQGNPPRGFSPAPSTPPGQLNRPAVIPAGSRPSTPPGQTNRMSPPPQRSGTPALSRVTPPSPNGSSQGKGNGNKVEKRGHPAPATPGRPVPPPRGGRRP